MLENQGSKYLSIARYTGWGGAAIIVNLEKFSLEILLAPIGVLGLVSTNVGPYA